MPLSSTPRNVLYFSPGEGLVGDVSPLSDLLDAARRVEGCEVTGTDGYTPHLRYRDTELVIHVERHRSDVLRRLHHEYWSLVIVDLRCLDKTGEAIQTLAQAGMALLRDMDAEAETESRFGFHRVLALVAHPDDERADSLIADLGRRHVGCVIRDRSTRPRKNGASAAAAAFARRVLDEAVHRIRHRTPGRHALCASGGGITGIHFEIGALKCLDDCLGLLGVNGFDEYYGISAGAIVAGFLANGFSPDELMAGVLGRDVGRVGRLDLNLVRAEHIDFAELSARFLRTTRDALGLVWSRLRGGRALTPEDFVLRYSDVLGPPLRGDRFEEVLRQCFSIRGATNDFRQLPRPLFVGATDQDRREHVLFGAPGADDVPISKAIQGSFSVNPFFTSAQIGDRYYEDGQVTRTSNLVEALRHGADLVIILDPFLPYVSKEPGFARKRGVVYNIDQDIRALSWSRLERARADLLRRYPHVSTYTFVPANSLRRLMSINPMDHRPFLAIWRGAYLSTLARIHQVEHRLRGDLVSHGRRFDTARADAVAARLRATEAPRFEDFFPEGKALVKMPPLCRSVGPTRQHAAV